MTDIFIWNEQSAEQVRRESERALQGQSSDMKETALLFTNRATNLEMQATALLEQSNAMLATLPIMKTIHYPISDPNGYTGYSTKQVEDTAASQNIASSAADMQARAEELRRAALLLRTSANSLTRAATELDHKIQSTNNLFRQMFEYAQKTDARYAARIQDIKDQISAYIYRMEALRDSFDFASGSIDLSALYRGPSEGWSDFKHNLSAEGVKLVLSERAHLAGLRVWESNSPINWSEAEWNAMATILQRPLAHEVSGTTIAVITQEHFAALARRFAELTYAGDMERFLNMMAFPVDMEPFQNSIAIYSEDFTKYRACPLRIGMVQMHLELQVAVITRQQMSLPLDSQAFRGLQEDTLRLMQSSAILHVAAEIAAISHQSLPGNAPNQRLLACMGNGPFSIGRAQVQENLSDAFTINVQHARMLSTETMNGYRVAFSKLSDYSVRGNNTVYVWPAVRGPDVEDFYTNFAEEGALGSVNIKPL